MADSRSQMGSQAGIPNIAWLTQHASFQKPLLPDGSRQLLVSGVGVGVGGCTGSQRC